MPTLEEFKEQVKRRATRWDPDGPISSGYLAHHSYLFFTSIRIVFLSHTSMLSESSDTDFSGQVVYKP